MLTPGAYEAALGLDAAVFPQHPVRHQSQSATYHAFHRTMTLYLPCPEYGLWMSLWMKTLKYQRIWRAYTLTGSRGLEYDRDMRSASSTRSRVEVELDAQVARRRASRRVLELEFGPPVTAGADLVEHHSRLQVTVPSGHLAAARAVCSRAATARRRGAAARARIEATASLPLDDASVGAVIEVLSSTRGDHLDDEGRLARLRLADRVASWAQATAATALADYAAPVEAEVLTVDPQEGVRRDRHLRLEVRIARGISDAAAGMDILAARRLTTELEPVRVAWSQGLLSYRHVASFLAHTEHHRPDAITALLDHLGDRIYTTPATRIGAVIATALARLDPAGQAERARVVRRHDVGVIYRGLPDGLAQVVATHRVEDARALMEHIDTAADQLLAHRRDCPSCAAVLPDEIGPARAAAHASLVLRETCDHTATQPVDTDTNAIADGAVRTRGRATRRARARRGELQVVVDLATLLGLADNPGLLAGQPVPAEIARELAADCGALRRIITDPRTGALLDYGARTYLPEPLRAFVAARDGTCTSPGCNQPAARSQLDHITPWPHGPSTPDNTHMLCKRDHDTKTAGDIDVRARGDGRTSWTTRHGQTGVTPPRPYLPDTGPLRDNDVPTASDDCPF
jgi:hypothetical protein